MNHTVIKNAIPKDTVDYIVDFFDNSKHLYFIKENNPNVIKINQPWMRLQDELEPIFEKYFKCKNGSGGNIYKHTNLYDLHVDSHEPIQMINALVPLYVHNPKFQQKFVVFDQSVENGQGITWLPSKESERFELDFNKTVIIPTREDNRIHDKTDKNIDEDFYKKYLHDSDRTLEYFYGLSGHAYDFTPGDLILFNSNFLHCTGPLAGDYKIGMHINFEGSLDELLYA